MFYKFEVDNYEEHVHIVQSLDIESCQYRNVNLAVYEIYNKCMQFYTGNWGSFKGFEGL